MELKKGSVSLPVFETTDTEVSRKWAEFESLSFRDLSAQFLIGAEAYQSSTQQESLNGSQNYYSNIEEAEQPATSSQNDASDSKETLPSVNGAHIIQTNTAEALQKEVRKTYKTLNSKCLHEQKHCESLFKAFSEKQK